jgi:uncharacterized protein (DUF1778 family)
MSEKRGPGRPPVGEATQETRIQLRALESEKTLFERASAAVGMTFSEWVRSRLTTAARRDLRRKAD